MHHTLSPDQKPRLPVVFVLGIILFLAGFGAPSFAQGPTVEVIREDAGGVVLEIRAAWPDPLASAAGGAPLSGALVLAAAGGHHVAARALPLPALAVPDVQVQTAEFDEIALPGAVGAEGEAWAALLSGPHAAVEGVGLERKKPVGSFAAKLLAYDPDRNVLRRYRRMVVAVRYTAPASPVAAKRTAPSPHLAVAQSVLAEATWFKIPVTREGIYRIDRAYLTRLLGSAPDGVDPATVRVFGNGGEPLPALNSAPRPVDLVENPVFVQGGGDGSFQAGDAVYFFARGPSGWRYDEAEGTWAHYVNPFSRENYYFIRVGAQTGEPMAQIPFPDLTGPEPVSQFQARFFVEEDREIPLQEGFGSGMDWLGPRIEGSSPNKTMAALRDTLPAGLAGGEVRYRARVATRSDSRSFPYATLVFRSAAGELARVTPPGVNPNYDAAAPAVVRFSEPIAPGARLKVDLTLEASRSTDIGWLDWLEVFYPRLLQAESNYLRFHAPERPGSYELTLTGFTAEPQVWDVTEPGAVRRLAVQAAGSGYRIRLVTGSRPAELVAFTPDAAAVLTPADGARIPNQNLHGLTAYPDFVIVTPAEFAESARRLADHRRQEGLEVVVADVQEIYNEFSGGVPDMRAVRDYFKFLYDRAPDEARLLRYALLFGDGHFDFRGLVTQPGDNKNWIFPYETEETLERDATFTSDDYFGLLDDTEGVWNFPGSTGVSWERVDLGIGRFTVQSKAEAETVVQKVLHYENPETFGAWRARYTFVADDDLQPSDRDDNLHTQNADVVAQLVDVRYPGVNLKKVYAISYPKVPTGFYRQIPGAKDDLLRAIREGTLVWNYSGHGGTEGLTDERIFEREDVAKLDNYDRLTVFVTATCSFGHWDINTKQSTAEDLLVHPAGGAVALFTTVRLVYTIADPNTLNLGLNLELNRHLLSRDEQGLPRRLGDAMQRTKSASSGIGALGNNVKFNLLGDPTLRIGLPVRRVDVKTINGIPVAEQTAPLRALEKVVVEGQVVDLSGQPDAAFDGIVELTVFDAARKVDLPTSTHGISHYSVQNDLIYRGQARAAGGAYRIEFVVPKDISYSNQAGRISLYAWSGATDGLGSTENVVVGGTVANPPSDAEGPEIELFLNDTTFVSGGLTGLEPELIVRLFDENGLNTVGTGVGHEMLLVIDENEAGAINIGDRFQGAIGSYRAGEVRYKLPEQAAGPHVLRVKAWDVLNNSTTAEVTYFVAPEAALAVRNVYNYPNPTVGPTRFVFEHNQPPGTPARVQVRVYTLAGRPVLTLDEEEALPGGVLPAGPVQIPWNGVDDDFDPLPTGIYLYRVRVEVDQSTGERQVAETIERLAVIR